MANYIPHFPVGPRPRPAVSAWISDLPTIIRAPSASPTATPCGGALPTRWSRRSSQATSLVRLLRSATQCGPGPRCPSRLASLSDSDIGARTMSTLPLVDLPARQENKQPPKGRPVVKRARRIPAQCRASHAGMPMGRGCNAQACRRDPTCLSARVLRRCECSDSLPGRISLQLGRYLFRYQRSAGARPSCITDNNSRVMRWSVCADHERALSQIWVKAAARSVGELSGRSECRVRTGAICLVGEAVEKVTSHENAIHIECRVRL